MLEALRDWRFFVFWLIASSLIMSTGNGVEDLCITLEANLMKKQMEFKTNLCRIYNRRFINLEQNMKLVENRYNEHVEKMYVNYIFYIASVESMLLYLYIG